MKIAAIESDQGQHLVLAYQGGLVDIGKAAQYFSIPVLAQPLSDLISQVIENESVHMALKALNEALSTLSKTQLEPFFIQDVTRWLPPLKRPGKILGVAMNNKASDARKISAPSHPAFFLKPSSCMIGHQQPIEVRDYYGSVHPEPELALVIGKRVKDISAQDAWDAIYGYTIFNDITGNDMRGEDRFHYWALYPNSENPDELERREQHLSYAARYKGSDGFGPIGPWVVSADEISDPHALAVQCWHQGELIAQDSTAYMNYKANEVIAFISKYQTLEPGDIISLGTAFKPQAGSKRSLHLANLTRLGGEVIIEIEGIGRLQNPVVKV